jgi:hypothetical protein
MKFTHLMTCLCCLASWNDSVGQQQIEKMDKKELRIELSARRTEIDSMMNINLSLISQITMLKNSYDSLKNIFTKTKLISDKIEAEIIDKKSKIIILENKNNELSRKIDSLMDSLNKSNNSENYLYYIRELIINKYLRNKTFKLKYYNSYDGVGPNGGSFTSIIETNDKYYIGDMINGGKQNVRLADYNDQLYYNAWSLNIDNNLQFRYNHGNEVIRGSINIKSTKWSDYITSDSTYFSSLITNQDQLKLPIGFIQLETIRGPFNFMIYFLVGEEKYWFNGKEYGAFNSVIIQSNNVQVIMSNIN